MTGRARAAGRAGRVAKPALQLVALRAFHVWHRDQMVLVPQGIIHDTALVATLRGINDPSLLEWR